jgi:hypothetical protein
MPPRIFRQDFIEHTCVLTTSFVIFLCYAFQEQGVSPHSEKLSANEDPEEFPNEDVFEHTFAEIPNIDHSNQTDEAIPETFDAREEWPQCKDVIGKVWDQGACQSCWVSHQPRTAGLKGLFSFIKYGQGQERTLSVWDKVRPGWD